MKLQKLGFWLIVLLTSGSASQASPPSAPLAPTPNATSGNADTQVAAIYKQSRDAYAALSSYSDTGTMSSQMGTFSQEGTFTTRLQRPGFYRVAWSGSMTTGVVWSDGTGDYLHCPGLPNEKQKDQSTALAGATGISGGTAATIPASFFRQHWGDALNGVGECHQLPDDKVDDIPCTVVASTIDSAAGKKMTTTLWIGQQDHLIHKFQQVASGLPSIPPVNDDSVKSILQGENKPAIPEAIAALRTQLNNAQEAAKKLSAHGITFIQIHRNIQTNQAFTAADFRPDK